MRLGWRKRVDAQNKLLGEELEGKISNEKIKRLLATGSREQLARESAHN
jgi:hypothetical protein